MKKVLYKFILAVVLAGSVQGAYAADPKPEEEIRYRQSVFNVIGRNFNALGAIAKGERPYDQAFAVKTANLVELLAPLPFGSFGPGTDKGALHRSDAKIWTDQAKYKEATDKFLAEVSKLSTSAKDLNSLKAQVGEIGKTCKGCHDDFRLKEAR
ncbi:cytochrome c [Methylobacillus arboreus]|uniref:c-type cytochrome n=1 Tax=Methylobacillus arboreus TaxID=755170 RepID=UPI001E3C1F4B|nr:cytochrome c [Methylobacillus arboreus]MCB5189145.1 cytochrome c [Methylobacillus arboreus]